MDSDTSSINKTESVNDGLQTCVQLGKKLVNVIFLTRRQRFVPLPRLCDVLIFFSLSLYLDHLINL